jgi:hypothetical protein
VAKRDLKESTTEELLLEVRRRERQRAAGGTRGAESTAGRHDALRAVSTERLVRTLRDRQRVVYGVDDRKDLYKVRSTRVRQVAGAVAALVRAADLTQKPDGSYELATESYKDAYGLCGSEPFAAQPLGCFCSGFLVKPDVVATAGHCVKGAADLATIRFVFGFHMTDADSARTTFAADDVYEGTRVLGRELTDSGPDWALVRLDRPVVGREPLAFRRAGKVADAQAIFVIGHPNGLPAKYAPGARVRDNSPDPYFVANLDTYGGNSGSPVFNGRSYEVEGILVRGENDFVSDGGCNVSLVCPTSGCRGEDVTRSTVWSGEVPADTRRRSAARGRGRRGR